MSGRNTFTGTITGIVDLLLAVHCTAALLAISLSLTGLTAVIRGENNKYNFTYLATPAD